MKFAQKNLNDLHKRLHAVMPEIPPISQFNGKSGRFKAIDQEGRVSLVTWLFEEGKPAYRSEEFVMDYNTLLRKSDDKVSGNAPSDGWDVDGNF